MPAGPQPAKNKPPVKRARARRGTLSRERIVDAAWAVIERDGIDSFSIRRVASELQVGAMSLYRHFETKDDLIDAVIDAAAAQIPIPQTRGPWKARLRELALALHETLQEHPDLVRLRLRRPLLSPGALRFTQAGMAILRGAGFSDADAVRAYRALYLYCLGSVAFSPSSTAKAAGRLTRETLSSLPTTDFPDLVAVADEAARATEDDTIFEFALDLLLAGLEQRLVERTRVQASRAPGA